MSNLVSQQADNKRCSTWQSQVLLEQVMPINRKQSNLAQTQVVELTLTLEISQNQISSSINKYQFRKKDQITNQMRLI